jgi:type 1 fimbria pilin
LIMKKYSLVIAALLTGAATYALGQTPSSGGTITFSGQIVDVQPGQQLTTVTPKQTTDDQGNPQTVYVVSSSVTGAELATFTTQGAAQTFASQVMPQVALRSP